MSGRPLQVRWLGQVRYRDALALQNALFASDVDYLLLLEHSPVFTLGSRASLEHLLCDPVVVGADVERADRGGDITWHGPGQLVGYPILTLPDYRAGLADITAHVRSMEQLVIDVVTSFGLTDVGRLADYPGVWVGVGEGRPRKIAAVGSRVVRRRSKHGFALNVAPDMEWFTRLVPCGISEYPVTSLAGEGVDVSMREVTEAVALRAAQLWSGGSAERAEVAWRVRPTDMAAFTRDRGIGSTSRDLDANAVSVRVRGRLEEAGVDHNQAVRWRERKPEWMRTRLRLDGDVAQVRSTVKELRLVTVCEEAGCPNLSECWSDGTATFMINGDRCTRACGFCLVDTRKPEPLDPSEPHRVAEAVARMDLRHAVVTCVARDDVPDGGAAAFAATIGAIRAARPECAVEVLVSDFQGDPAAIDSVIAARPDVFNHNVETVARLQRAVRPSASYARSLAVLGRASAAGLVVKSGLVLGMGETDDEVVLALRDLRSVGVSIVTLGQYLRPTAAHVPVQRWWTPAEFECFADVGRELGFAHVESSPLTRSSYHARSAAGAAAVATCS